ELTTLHSKFPKPVSIYKILLMYGPNIIASEGHIWKKHRKIAAPTFSEANLMLQRNNKLVWDETIRIVSDMMNSWGPQSSEILINNCVQDITLPVALMVISAAAFGRRVSWAEESMVAPNHVISFRTSLYTMASNMMLRLITPRWLGFFSRKVRFVHQCSEELESYMLEMIEERRLSLAKGEEYADLFSSLLQGSEAEEGDERLSDKDLIGNIFVFLLAGYETTAHTLGFALGLLALHKDVQEKLYEQISSVVPKDTIPVYEQIHALPLVQATIYETLRLIPIAPAIPKVAAEDLTLPTMRPNGSIERIPVPKGTIININIQALHKNPRYWPDPERFDPSRFLSEYTKEAFMPFSSGMAGCYHYRFSEVEARAVAVLTMILSKYRVDLKNPEEYELEGLTMAEKREKVLKPRIILTIT
ncbi:hypothetical protein M422DRAFT_177891, partial [Sphaerobolus stellatus SS14]